MDGTYESEQKQRQNKERERAEEIATELSNKRKTETTEGADFASESVLSEILTIRIKPSPNEES